MQVFLAFDDTSVRDSIYEMIAAHANIPGQKSARELADEWSSGVLSNFDYILALNRLVKRVSSAPLSDRIKGCQGGPSMTSQRTLFFLG